MLTWILAHAFSLPKASPYSLFPLPQNISLSIFLIYHISLFQLMYFTIKSETLRYVFSSHSKLKSFKFLLEFIKPLLHVFSANISWANITSDFQIADPRSRFHPSPMKHPHTIWLVKNSYALFCCGIHAFLCVRVPSFVQGTMAGRLPTLFLNRDKWLTLSGFQGSMPIWRICT